MKTHSMVLVNISHLFPSYSKTYLLKKIYFSKHNFFINWIFLYLFLVDYPKNIALIVLKSNLSCLLLL
jgi:hypothetical protein